MVIEVGRRYNSWCVIFVWEQFCLAAVSCRNDCFEGDIFTVFLVVSLDLIFWLARCIQSVATALHFFAVTELTICFWLGGEAYQRLFDISDEGRKNICGWHHVGKCRLSCQCHSSSHKVVHYAYDAGNPSMDLNIFVTWLFFFSFFELRPRRSLFVW